MNHRERLLYRRLTLGGAKTATLKSGKPLTLVNTATGARYRISLVSVGSGEQASEPAPTPKP